jgi:2-keto-3-deoxy-L-rhamnonate aldolase RhmA
MTHINALKEKVLSRIPVFGVWSLINSPAVVEIVASAGMDFQIFDMEHGIFDLPSLEECIRTAESRKCTPFVRVPGLIPSIFQNCLDCGAQGIIVPQIRNYDDAVYAVKCAKFPPLGIRGFNPFTRAGNFRGAPTDPQFRLSNDFSLTGVIIENKTAYDDLDRILTIPHLDIIYLGVYDMSVALGCMGDMSNPALLEFVSKSIGRIRNAGKAPGLMVKNETDSTKYLDLGATFFVYRVDTEIIFSAVEKGVNMFAALKKRSPGSLS